MDTSRETLAIIHCHIARLRHKHHRLNKHKPLVGIRETIVTWIQRLCFLHKPEQSHEILMDMIGHYHRCVTCICRLVKLAFARIRNVPSRGVT